LAVDCVDRNSDKIAGLVLLAPLFEVSSQRSPLNLPPKIWFSLARICLPFITIVENKLPLDAFDRNIAESHPRDIFIPMRIYDELFKLIDSINSTPQRIELPILLIVAANDQVVNPNAAKKWIKKHATQSNIIELPHSGHLIPLDTQWMNATLETVRFIKLNNP